MKPHALFAAMALVAVLAEGCAHAPPARAVTMDAITVTGDLDLERLNDEELFASGSSAYAAADYAGAVRYFSRLADFHPGSPHYRKAVFNLGLAHERLEQWASARERFAALSDPTAAPGDALDASFRLAEALYHLEAHEEAATLLRSIAARGDLAPQYRIEAAVQQGVCELEADQRERAEATFRRALQDYDALEDKLVVDDYFPAQAQFFLGEIYRLHYETVRLDPDRGVDQLAKDLEYKAGLLLSAQGHYLRSIRIGNGHWATASGAQIGGLYDDLYHHMVNAKAPRELQSEEEIQVYRDEVRKRIRVLLTKAIAVYERTLEAAERIGSKSVFTERTRESLKRMKDRLLADTDDPEPSPGSPAPSDARGTTHIGG